MKISNNRLRLYVKINFLILAFFVVIFLMKNLREKGLSEGAIHSLQIEQQQKRTGVFLKPETKKAPAAPQDKARD